jgi:hypothetical protein
MPYIAQEHVSVYVNRILQLNPMHYTWSNTSTILFAESSTPELNDAIEIKRWTSPNATLVDFVNGSVLGEQELDAAYLHNFYLSQEYADSFNELINEALFGVATDIGIVEIETDAIIAALVSEMLADANAANLQQRIADIDINAEAIITLGDALQVQINTLATGIAAQVFIQPGEPVPGVGGIPDPIPEGARWYDSDDNNHPYIYQASAWLSIDDPRVGQLQTDLAVLNVEVDDNAAAVITESVARANADSATASQLALLGAQNGAQTAWIINLNTVQITDGVESLADRFTSLQASIDSNAGTGSTNAASIISEQTARVNGDNANASSITAIDSRLTTAEGTVASHATSISSITTDVTAAQGDIIANASDISGLLVSVDLRATTFYQALSPTANNIGDLWIDSDNDTLFRWNGTIWVAIQDVAIAGNASAITAIDTRVSSAEGTISSHSGQITTLQSDVVTVDGRVDSANVTIAAHTSAISGNDGDIATLYAKYGVTLNVNGYITGFIQNNDGQTGTFVILADKFAVVDPSGDPAEPEYVPFSISGGKIVMTTDVTIDGDLIVTGSINGNRLINATIGSTQIGPNAITTSHIGANQITANEILAGAITADKINVANLSAVTADMGTITAGTITLSTSGWIKGGQTAYDTGTGFFLGYSGAAYKFSIGNGTTQKLTWDGTELEVLGNVIVGTYIVDATETVAEANTERSKTGSTYTEVKKFTMDRGGEVRVSWDYKSPDSSYAASNIRVKVNGTTKNSNTYNVVAAYTNDYWDLTGANSLDPGDIVTIEYLAGKWWSDGPEPGTIYIKNAQLRAVVTLPGTVTVNTD